MVPRLKASRPAADRDLFGRKLRKPPPPLERQTHIALADFLRWAARPDVLWTHFPAGEYRTEATGALLKRMGVATGWSDFIFMPLDGRMAFLELKRRGEQPSDSQINFAEACRARGLRHAICYSFSEAEETLRGWGFLKDGVQIRA